MKNGPLLPAIALLLASCAEAGESPPATAEQRAAPVAAFQPPADGERQLLWGDTHLHTINSTDRFLEWLGQRRHRHGQSFFARGQPVIHPRTGAKIRIDRPLDFLVVADHGEFLSVSRRMRDGDAKVMATPSGQWMREVFTGKGGAELARRLIAPPSIAG